MARIDPLRNFRFRLEIDSITQAGFSEVDDRRDDDRRRRLPRRHRSAARPQAERPHQVRQRHAEVGIDRRRHGARPLQVAQRRLRRPGQGEAQEGRHRRPGRGGRRRRALRHHRRLAGQVRPERPQRQGQRGGDRAARARQRRHRAGGVRRTCHEHQRTPAFRPRSSSSCRRATSTTPARCTGAARCAWRPRPTRSCRCATRACSRTRPISRSSCWPG